MRNACHLYTRILGISVLLRGQVASTRINGRNQEHNPSSCGVFERTLSGVMLR